ncbi:MAG: tetratricopeptide repeat protein [Bacteroidales bacterium]|nr:tetratricopeptide repeat protein [Bacteroidales bacterium]MCF8345210.1 tetratricopeptide repeat protein [Bacteroidales bacterium]MCF8352371.1 tetratricopeptide repeat protein [Bacteroidales bacterium]MCF8377027.1 tetratricopeptide repeat protein [Bacteroidales bacterium]MCF8400894.1 tetratricopeptide repeat protein [Bacteroidales bacterium]
MKKTVLAFIMLFTIAAVTYGQTRNRTTAYNHLRRGELAEAAQYINMAITHEKTMNDPKTWFYRGNIYYDIATDSSGKYDTINEPLLTAVNSFEKAMKYDEKNQYLIEIMRYMSSIANFYYRQGYESFRDRDFEKAMVQFHTAYETNEAIDRIDTAALYNAGLAAENAKRHDKAKEFYLQLYEWDYDDPGLYESLSNVYRETGDTTRSFEFIEIGREKYPDDYNILIAEINFHIKTGNTQAALNSLEKAIKKDSANYTIWFALGDMYDNMITDTTYTEEQQNKYFDKAVNAYEQAIEYKPDYTNAYFNIGAIYVDKASEIQNEANQLGMSQDELKEYDRLTAKADSLLAKALPYLENAHKYNPEDMIVVQSLKQIYNRLKMDEKLKELE